MPAVKRGSDSWSIRRSSSLMPRPRFERAAPRVPTNASLRKRGLRCDEDRARRPHGFIKRKRYANDLHTRNEQRPFEKGRPCGVALAAAMCAFVERPSDWRNLDAIALCDRRANGVDLARAKQPFDAALPAVALLLDRERLIEVRHLRLRSRLEDAGRSIAFKEIAHGNPKCTCNAFDRATGEAVKDRSPIPTFADRKGRAAVIMRRARR